jgi:hypothetical protein
VFSNWELLLGSKDKHQFEKHRLECVAANNSNLHNFEQNITAVPPQVLKQKDKRD